MQHAMVANDGARSRVGMAFSTVFADASGNIGHSHGNFIAVVEFAPRLRAVYHPGE